MERAAVESDQVTHVIMGQVLQAGSGQVTARQAAFKAGLAKTVTSETINRVCGSGMRAINLADLLIRAGEHDVVIAGGMESMSNAPYLLRKARFGYRFGDGVLEDSMIGDGLFCAQEQVQMGVHGDTVAAELGLTREVQDAWALRSHQRSISAIDAGRLGEEIVPVEVTEGKQTRIIDTDEAP